MTTMLSKFSGTCQRCLRRFGAGTTIEWSRATGALHADPAVCAAAAATPVPPPVTLAADHRPIVALLEGAKARGLKFPKARFLAPNGGELRLSLAGAGSQAPGSLQVCVDDTWLGRIEPNGTVRGPKLLADLAVGTLLVTIAANPAEAARAYGALMCRCSFCNLALTDAGSVEVGYGPTCAKKWGLPHAPKGTPNVQAVA
jgi:Family of unknown function (DUF6011)